MTLPLDSTVQAEYADGYVLDETEHNDISLFGEGNIFTDILKKRHEASHGPMVRFSVFWKDQRYDIDWTQLPDNARPIRFRHGYSTTAGGIVVDSGWSGVDVGAQWNDESGKNVQDVTELR